MSIVNRNRELTSRDAEMEVGACISYWTICHLEWAVGTLGKRLSHICLFKDSCFVSCWAFSICDWLSLSWLNLELLFHITPLNNWMHINKYFLKTAVDPCSSQSETKAQSCGACFIQMTALWRPVQQRFSVLLLWSSNCHFNAVSKSLHRTCCERWVFLTPPL